MGRKLLDVELEDSETEIRTFLRTGQVSYCDEEIDQHIFKNSDDEPEEPTDD